MSTLQGPARGVFRDILYSQCWEDPEIDRAAFATCSTDKIFTITSGGCNALAFLLDDPQSVTAADLNISQNHLLEIKMAALRELSYGELLEFLGVITCRDRMRAYRRLRSMLSGEARTFWDAREQDVRGGILHCGRFERYLSVIRRLTRYSVGKRAVWGLFDARTEQQRRDVYDRHWSTLRWSAVTRTLLSRTVMTLMFDGAFFAQLHDDISFGRHFHEVIRRALVTLPVSKSPFLSYALLGYFRSHDCLPVYVREETVPIIRARLDRIRIVHADCESHFATLPANSYTRFNFTNIFEWMPVGAYEHLLRETIRVASDGAVLTYRNLLVPRSHPPSLNRWICSRPLQAKTLHETDLSFLYRSYAIEVIRHEHNHGH